MSGATSYISPLVASLILNYRHDKWAITPSFQWQTGGFYGNPLDINGYDPRACTFNSADPQPRAAPITKVSPKTDPLRCNVLPGSVTFLVWASSVISTSPIRKRATSRASARIKTRV